MYVPEDHILCLEQRRFFAEIGPRVSAFDFLGSVVKAALILYFFIAFIFVSCFTTNVQINK